MASMSAATVVAGAAGASAEDRYFLQAEDVGTRAGDFPGNGLHAFGRLGGRHVLIGDRHRLDELQGCCGGKDLGEIRPLKQFCVMTRSASLALATGGREQDRRYHAKNRCRQFRQWTVHVTSTENQDLVSKRHRTVMGTKKSLTSNLLYLH
jgi:hypothetical protein